jgi:hypothetical protein
MVTLDFDNELTNNWDSDYHVTGKSVPADSSKWGLKILDWDNSFKKRLKKFKVTDLAIPFQYLDTIPNWDKGADWKDIGDIMGRFEPPVVYGNSGGQDITIVMIYYAEALQNAGASTHWTLENIEMYVKRLQSLVYPQYDGRYAPPMKLLFNIGNIYKNIPIVVKNVSVESTAPFDTVSGLPRMRKITLNTRVNYPMYQTFSQAGIYTTWDGVRTNGKNGSEIFAYEKLDSTWTEGSSSNNPWNTQF